MYPIVKRAVCSATVASFLLGGIALLPAQAPDKADSKSPAADNTKVNKRDRNKGEPTADNAKDTKPDRELMREIRKAITDDKSLSTNAHNVKIIAQHGKVTLKGPVQSEEEKSAVVSKATEVAGAGNVTDELTVKASRAKKNKDKSDKASDKTNSDKK
jgi:osmotically-inducible protein OsmY